MDGEHSTFECECCGKPYHPRRNLDGSIGRTKYKACSSTCANRLYGRQAYKRSGHEAVRIARKCGCCGKAFIASQSINLYCSPTCREAEKRKRSKNYPIMRESRKARDSKRRALKRTTTVERIEPIKVFERDRWICHLCGIRTLKSKRGTRHPRAPELEHIVSLADGGTHTWGNVACSCSACNRAKGAKSIGQLAMDFVA